MGNSQCCSDADGAEQKAEVVSAGGKPKMAERASAEVGAMAAIKQEERQPPTASGGEADAPSGSRAVLKLGLAAADGTVTDFTFNSSPLGLDFSLKHLPMKVKKVHGGSAADKQGAVTGMKLVSVNGEDVAKLAAQELHSLLKKASADLVA